MSELKKILENKKMRLIDLAKLTRISTSTLCAIQNGYVFPSMKRAKFIAETLGVEVSQAFPGISFKQKGSL
jgi:transcriptional regulator with XRE-family HTH domain